jgi:hypothetical protein
MAEKRKDTQGTERLAEEIGREANVNQVRHEPMPASQHDDRRQEAVERNEDYAHQDEERRQAEERG